MLPLKGVSMKPNDLILRCYAERQGKIWVAVCVDLCLAAQDYDPNESVRKLHLQIADHIQDAFENPQFTNQMLTRKAPLTLLAKFYWIKFKYLAASLIRSKKAQGSEKVFCEAMPLKLA